MATTWRTVIEVTDSGRNVKYQVESSAPDEGTGAGNRHRILENGTPYTPSPQGRPCRSPHYMATSFDPYAVLGYEGPTLAPAPTLLKVTDITPR